MDKNWIEQPVCSPAYIDGIYQFLEYAKTGMQDGKIICPCRKCKVGSKKRFSIDEVERHLLYNGFFKDYKDWIFHGPKTLYEHISNQETSIGEEVGNHEANVVGNHDISGMLREAFGVNATPMEGISTSETNDIGSFDNHDYSQAGRSYTHEDAKYRKLVELSNQELYPGCTNFSTLSFLLRLFNLKCMFHWPNKSVTLLLELLLDAFPQVTSFPSSYYEGKKLIKELGLGYENIHACPNDCMLYWGKNSNKSRCNVCQTSRWKTHRGNKDDVGGEESNASSKGTPAKVMKYFPLIPRLKRMYLSSKIAEDMVWHEKERVKDGKLRHPADALAWREFDARYPEFSSDPRSVRLNLASDGFNPYGIQNTNYSTWPVILSVSNLPPWLCMKSHSLVLSLIIPGKSGPGNDIDVYMQPLLHELKLLWEGVDAFDAYTREPFKLRAALMSTINDFPAYAMLSGWSTKGYHACPCCAELTHSYRCGSKICYGGHRKWLPDNHPFRSQSSLFDGTEEHGHAPTPKCGSDILRAQQQLSFRYGKTPRPLKKRGRKSGGSSTIRVAEDDDNDGDAGLWNKRSIFFDLPYWEYHRLRHNLDVMHIEKNVCENVLVTLLNVEGKCKDDENARLFLEENNIRQHLWLQPQPDGNFLMPPAPYYMSAKDKERFLNVLAKLKVPDGYASNLSRCVNVKQRKLLNLKSHDHHILMQDILPIALRASGTTQVADVLSDLSVFFKSLCSKSIDPGELDGLQANIVETLCRLEMEFLPPFFTIMVHLLVHLVDQVKLCGPVQYGWMYPIERNLARLKAYVRNKARPEGSIAEGYVLEETVTFCSRYIEGTETVFNKLKRNDDGIPHKDIYLFNSGGRHIGAEKIVRLEEKSMAQAHRYVLLHFDDIMKDLQEEFLHQKREECLRKGIRVNQALEAKWMLEEFSEWLKSQAHNIDASSENGELKIALARGLNMYAKRLKGYIINGFKFHTVDRERNRKTQNSGVMVEADGDSYYGKLTDIYEIDFYGTYKVVLFRCDWVDITSPRGLKRDRKNCSCVNFSKLMHTGRLLKDDPFIFSSQAKQVFYVEDEIEKGWLHIVCHKTRDLYNLGVVSGLVSDDIDT